MRISHESIFPPPDFFSPLFWYVCRGRTRKPGPPGPQAPLILLCTRSLSIGGFELFDNRDFSVIARYVRQTQHPSYYCMVPMKFMDPIIENKINRNL